MPRSAHLTAQQATDRLAVSPKTIARWSKADQLARQLTQPTHHHAA